MVLQPNGWYTIANGGGLCTSFDISCWALGSAPNNGPKIDIRVDGEFLLNGHTTLKLADDTDICLFQKGDEVQPGVNIYSTDVANKTIMTTAGGKWLGAFNDGEVWSETTSADKDVFNGFTYDKAFNGSVVEDGTESNFAGWLVADGDVAITFPNTPVEGQVVIYSGDGLDGDSDATVTVGSKTEVLSGSGYVSAKVFNLSGDLKRIVLTNSGGGVRFYGVEIDGKVLLDAGADGPEGDSRVSTTAPKQGRGTIQTISGNVVTIKPFTNNCFKIGQWLTVDQVVEVDPLTDPIASYDPDAKTITLTETKDLAQFDFNDEVYMTDDDGNPAVASISTSAATQVEVAEIQNVYFGTSDTIRPRTFLTTN